MPKTEVESLPAALLSLPVPPMRGLHLGVHDFNPLSPKRRGHRGWNPGELLNARVDHARRQLGSARQGPASEGAGEQFEHVSALHVPAEGAQELERLDWTL